MCMAWFYLAWDLGTRLLNLMIAFRSLSRHTPKSVNSALDHACSRKITRTRNHQTRIYVSFQLKERGRRWQRLSSYFSVDYCWWFLQDGAVRARSLCRRFSNLAVALANNAIKHAVKFLSIMYFYTFQIVPAWASCFLQLMRMSQFARPSSWCAWRTVAASPRM